MLMCDSLRSFTLFRREDLDLQLAQAVDSGEELVPGLGGADAGRRAGHDEVAGFQRVVLREEGDLLGHAPDHLVDIGVLANGAVDLQPELALRRVPDFRGGSDGADRGSLIEVLAEGPGPALVLADLLKIAPGHVQAYRVAPDVPVG